MTHHALMQQLQDLGPVIDPPAMARLYAPLLAQQGTAGLTRVEHLAYGPDPRHRLDLYHPAGPAAGAWPVVLFFHGGGFIRGDKAERSHVGYFLARHGMLALLPSYRLAPAHPWPAGPQDVALALQWAQAHAAQWGGDRQRMVLVGESAGAAHVAAATLLQRFHPPGGLGAAGAMLISGVYNPVLEQRARQALGIPTPDPRNDAYFGRDASRHPAMSTVAQIDAPHLPLLITYAELDPLQQQVQAGELFATLCVQHQASPAIHMVRHHNHLSQIFSIGTKDMGLGGVLLEFVKSL